MKFAERAELIRPQGDDYVAVIAETARPASRHACNVLNSTVYAGSSEIEHCDTWVQDVWTLAGDEQIKIVADPLGDSFETGPGEVHRLGLCYYHSGSSW
jgi:hypothetical protein